MKYNDFTIRGNKMLYWRLGNMNSNKQTHMQGEGRKPPVSRGIWCFPYPHYDYFFCFHQWEKHLPKKFLRDGIMGARHGSYPDFDAMTEEEAQCYWDEREKKLNEIKNRIKPATFWYEGEFYSHIFPSGYIGGNSEWFCWESARAWSKVAHKTMYGYMRVDDRLHRFNYAKDHLEIFIANY